MELSQNTQIIIPKPFPNICESAHERAPIHRKADRNDTQASSQPVIKIIRLPSNQSHPNTPTQQSTRVASCFQRRSAETRPPPQQRLSTLCKPDISHLKPIPSPNSTYAIQTPAPIKQSPSTRIPIRQKHAFTPRKQASHKRGQIPTLPSSSTMSSSIAHPSAKVRSRAPRTTPTSPYPMPRPVQKREMSEKAVETVRVMEWTIAHVKAAEKRVREEERAAYAEKEFLLRLRIWEAEMKLQKMMENQEEESDGEQNEEYEGGRSDKRPSQIGEQSGISGMGRYNNFFVKRRKQCWAGLGVVLER